MDTLHSPISESTSIDTLPELVYTRFQDRDTRTGLQATYLKGEINVPKGTVALPTKFYSTVKKYDQALRKRFTEHFEQEKLSDLPRSEEDNILDGSATARFAGTGYDDALVSAASANGLGNNYGEGRWDPSLFEIKERCDPSSSQLEPEPEPEPTSHVQATLSVGIETKIPKAFSQDPKFSVVLYAKPTFAETDPCPSSKLLGEMAQTYQEIIGRFDTDTIREQKDTATRDYNAGNGRRDPASDNSKTYRKYMEDTLAEIVKGLGKEEFDVKSYRSQREYDKLFPLTKRSYLKFEEGNSRISKENVDELNRLFKRTNVPAEHNGSDTGVGIDVRTG
ncbi:hypothetical protein I302_100970 [Kwoniella bestiolae CBS 10118]|uniref:Uncharacterized protein n=1 Tax=Kwoniella bestiolae CBS 10118 TaxID=1296100 RepID=A0A1B9G6M1_9TREE|nr:hypothetical protein I302_04347 [Kwoniella bestiolae CBS 10118]OCF26660.1 hypothetical protein I302_04347 [Kwoniella bestiolae CBS 10118]